MVNNIMYIQKKEHNCGDFFYNSDDTVNLRFQTPFRDRS